MRRLGVGGSSSGASRPIRAQVVLALGGALLVLAVPLYLLRRPAQNDDREELPVPSAFAPSAPVEPPQDPLAERLDLEQAVRVKCSSSPERAGQRGRLCDQLPAIEEAFSKSIVETIDCAPQTGKGGTLNYVLKVDFDKRELHVFPGASGSWKGPQARRATQCVRQALPAPNWDEIAHQFRYYEIAVLATYQPPAPTSTPLFE